MIERTTTVRLSKTEKIFLMSLVGDKRDARYTTGVSAAIKKLIQAEMARQAAREVIETVGSERKRYE